MAFTLHKMISISEASRIVSTCVVLCIFFWIKQPPASLFLVPLFILLTRPWFGVVLAVSILTIATSDYKGDVHRVLNWLMLSLVVAGFIFQRLADVGHAPGARWRVSTLLDRGWFLPVVVSNTILLLAVVNILPREHALIYFSAVSLLWLDMLRRLAAPLSRPPALWRVAAYGTFIFITAAATAELAVRLLLPAYQSTHHLVAHPARGVALRPDYQTGLWLRPGEAADRLYYELKTNSLGLRDREIAPKQSGEMRVLMIGDSFTMGVGMQEDEMPSRLLERHLATLLPDRQISVLNAGVMGYGVWQSVLLLEEIGLSLEPDIVILQLFMSNDIHDELRRVDKVLQAYAPQQVYFWRTRRYEEYWSVWVDSIMIRYSQAYQNYIWSTGAEMPLMRMLKVFQPLGAYPCPVFPPSAERDPFVEHTLTHPYPALQESIALIKESVARAQQLCKANGIDLWAYAQPAPGLIRGELPVQSADGKLYDPEQDVELPERMFQELGVSYVRLADALRKSGNAEECFFPMDTHMTLKGNEILAEALAAAISQTVPPRKETP